MILGLYNAATKMKNVNQKIEHSVLITGILFMLGGVVRPQNHPVHHTSGISQESVDALSELIKKPTVRQVTRTSRGLCYEMNNGAKTERIGGTIAWRNNNPGCIRYSSNMVAFGAIGKADGFAVFPDEETGMRAIKSLLLSDSYRNLNISGAINKYAPPHENNTAHYISSLCNIVGVSRTTKICELNDEQMVSVINAIRKIEGWITGIELHTPAPKPEYKLDISRAMIDNTKCVWTRRMYEHTM